jgi:hypothetical protein
MHKGGGAFVTKILLPPPIKRRTLQATYNCIPIVEAAMKYSLIGAATAIAASMGGSAHAQGGDKMQFCVDYANEAVEMQRRNIRDGCGIKGARWHEWWDGHYGWCKDWVGPEQVREQTLLRRAEMERCDGPRGRNERGYDRRDERERRY